MNTPNNKRKKESMERIEKVFIELLQIKELNEISVSDICKRAGLNRTTFYANYTDIYGLADAIRDKLETAVSDLYKDEITQGFNSNDYLKLFRHIKENQIDHPQHPIQLTPGGLDQTGDGGLICHHGTALR